MLSWVATRQNWPKWSYGRLEFADGMHRNWHPTFWVLSSSRCSRRSKDPTSVGREWWRKKNLPHLHGARRLLHGHFETVLQCQKYHVVWIRTCKIAPYYLRSSFYPEIGDFVCFRSDSRQLIPSVYYSATKEVTLDGIFCGPWVQAFAEEGLGTNFP